MNDLRDRVLDQLKHVVIGQDEVAELMLSAVVLGGHVLLQGVPGVAKSLLAGAFARTLDGDYRRVQFTPDMLPSDLTGTMTLRAGELAFRPGPVFANVLLADEIASACQLVDATTVSEEVLGYVVAVVRATRTLPSVSLGASPRAAVHLMAAAKARARFADRDFVTPDDVAAMALPVLRHR